MSFCRKCGCSLSLFLFLNKLIFLLAHVGLLFFYPAVKTDADDFYYPEDDRCLFSSLISVCPADVIDGKCPRWAWGKQPSCKHITSSFPKTMERMQNLHQCIRTSTSRISGEFCLCAQLSACDVFLFWGFINFMAALSFFHLLCCCRDIFRTHTCVLSSTVW